MATTKKAAAKRPAPAPAKAATKRPASAPAKAEPVEELEDLAGEETAEDVDGEDLGEDTGEDVGEEEEGPRGKKRMSDKSQLAFALNNLLAFTVAFATGEVDIPEGTDIDAVQEIAYARSALNRAGFNEKPSTAQEIARIQEEIQNIDFSDPLASRRMKELAKELNRANSVAGLRA